MSDWKQNTMSTILIIVATVMNASAPISMKVTQDEQGQYLYNRYCVFFFAEVLKFSVAALWCLQLKTTSTEEAKKMYVDWNLFARYSGLGFFFFAQNNLSLFAIQHYSTSSYQLMMNTRIVLIAIMTVSVIGKKLNIIEWLAVLFITTGSLQHNMPCSGSGLRVSVEGLIVMMLCALAAAAGNIYTQLVMQQSDQPLMFQNLQLYVSGVLFNGINWYMSVNVYQSDEVWLGEISPLVFVEIMFFAAYGLCISAVLKNFGALTRTMVGAVAIILNAILDVVMFSSSISLFDATTFVVILVGVYMFSEVSRVIPKAEAQLPRTVAKP